MTRIAVIGDIGGHAIPLRDELTRLGVGDALPDDLIVVQVGDLIHRGPHSAEVVDLVGGFLRTQPKQWIQLIGNHEANYLRPPAFRWSETLSRKHVRTLKRWWLNGSATVATAIETPDESFLVTHAGITAEFWSSVLGGPTTAAEAASRINQLAKAGSGTVFRAGMYLHGKIMSDAGPLWADTTNELLPGWVDRRLPFSQIHGHNSVTSWRSPDIGAPRPGIEALITIDHDAKHETVYLEGGRLIGVDPDHRDTPTAIWRSLEITGTVTAR